MEQILTNIATFNDLTSEQLEEFKSTFHTSGRLSNELRTIIHKFWFSIPEPIVTGQDEEGNDIISDELLTSLNEVLNPHINVTSTYTNENVCVISLSLLTYKPKFDELSALLGDVSLIKLDPQIAFQTEADPAELLNQAKSNAKVRIKSERETLLSNGFEFGGKAYQTRDDGDRINIMGVGVAAQTALAAGSPFSVNFRATDNSVVTMDATTAIQFYSTMVGTAQAIWDGYNTAYSGIESATTPTEVYNITLL
jgi:hypothetical protein